MHSQRELPNRYRADRETYGRQFQQRYCKIVFEARGDRLLRGTDGRARRDSYNNENDAKTVEGLFGSTYALIFSTEVQRAVMEFLNKDWRDDFVPDEFNELCACVYCNAMTTEKAREFVEKNGEKTITIPHFGKRGIPFIHYDIKTQYDV